MHYLSYIHPRERVLKVNDNKIIEKERMFKRMKRFTMLTQTTYSHTQLIITLELNK